MGLYSLVENTCGARLLSAPKETLVSRFFQFSPKRLFLFAALIAATTARAQPGKCWDVDRDEPRLGACAQVIHYGPTQTDYTQQLVTLPVANDLAGGGSGEPGVDEALDQERPEAYQP